MSAKEYRKSTPKFHELAGGVEMSQIPLHDARGLWKGLGFDVTEEDIAEMRKEMWRNFPRDPR
jgi:hypothetical protein